MVEAAGRGEVVPRLPRTPKPRRKSSSVAAIGQPAPDFVATDFAGRGTARLSKWKGRPLVLVFYNPDSFTAPELLRFAQDLHVRWGKHVSVVGLCVSDDKARRLSSATS